MASEPESVKEGASPATNVPPRELNRLEILRALRLSVWEGAFAVVHSSLTTGVFVTGFALWLGAGNMALGVIGAIPNFAGLIQILASYFGERQQERRRFTAWSTFIGRSLWLPIFIAPFVLPHSMTLFVFLVLLALSSVLQNAAVPAWTSWMSDMVPADHRGRYFARRNLVGGIVGMVIALPAAWFLDVTTKRHPAPGLGFSILFGVAVFGAVLSFIALLRQPEPPRRVEPAPTGARGLASMLEFYRSPFADRNFRRFILFNVVFGLGQNLAAPFFTVYGLRYLGLGYVTLQALGTITSVTGLTSTPVWGYLADKLGNKPLLNIGVCGCFLLPLFWIPCMPNHLAMNIALLTMLNILGGVFWAGVNLTQFNLLIEFSLPERTSIYVAMMAAVTGLTGGIAPMIGSLEMRLLEGWHLPFFGFTFTNYHITFATAAFLRLASLLLLKPVIDAGSSGTREVLQQLGRVRPAALRYIRQIQRGEDEETKLRATEGLAESRTWLASGELEMALTDPSRAVREEAARALGEIGDPKSVEALLEALNDMGSGIEADVVRALGRIREEEAVAPLADLLANPPATMSRLTRLAVIRSLGEIGSDEAVDALMLELGPIAGEHVGEENTIETLARALGQAGDPRATELLIARLETRHVSPSVRLAVIRALGDLTDARATAILRTELARETEPVLIATLAVALSRLNDTGSLLFLYDKLLTLDSRIARKQVASAIGSLMGHAEPVYALLAQDEFGRDQTVAGWLQEVQRKARTTPATLLLKDVLNAYVAGEYAACLIALDAVAQPLCANPANSCFLCCQLIRHAAGSAALSPPLECVLLGLVSVRALILEAE